MIYNLTNYLITQLTALTFTADGFLSDTSEESITVIDNGGVESAWIDRKEYLVQVMSRSNDKTEARVNIYSVYDLLNRRFGLTLAAVTVKSIVYPAIKTYQISPNQLPGYIGSTDTHLEMWSVNFRVITE